MELNHRKRNYLILLCCFFVFAMVIIGVAWQWKDSLRSGRKESADVSPVESSEDTGEISENVLIWAVPEKLSINSEKLKRFNQKLYEAGYDFAVSFRKISYEDPFTSQEFLTTGKFECNGYRNELEKVLKEEQIDIVYGGVEYDSGFAQTDALCRKGYFYPFNDYLMSGVGKELYEMYDEELWESRSIDGKIYMIPHEEFPSFSSGTAFNLKYISKELAEAWDGTQLGLLKILDHLTIPNDVIPIASGLSMDTLASELGWEYHWGLYYDIDDQTVGNPYDSQEYKELLSVLHQMYQKGYIPDWVYMDDDELTEEISKRIETEQYVIGTKNVSETSSDFYVVQPFGFICNSLSDGTMIVKNSEYVKESLELLTLLHTQDEWANLFVFGQEGTDYDKSDDFVTPLTEESDDIDLAKTVFGLQDGLYLLEENIGIQNRTEKKQFLASDKRRHSNVLGFYLDTTGLEEELENFEKVSKKYKDCWREDDFEAAYAKAKKATDKAGEKIIVSVQKQMDQWKKSIENK